MHCLAVPPGLRPTGAAHAADNGACRGRLDPAVPDVPSRSRVVFGGDPGSRLQPGRELSASGRDLPDMARSTL